MDDQNLSLPVLGEMTDDADTVELPDLSDVENPILRRAIERIKSAKTVNAPQAHQKHASHDRTGHTSGLW